MESVIVKESLPKAASSVPQTPKAEFQPGCAADPLKGHLSVHLSPHAEGQWEFLEFEQTFDLTARGAL